MNIGDLIRQHRLARGLDQATLARRAGTTQTYISRVERGDVSPTVPTVERLLQAMGLGLRLDVGPLPCGNEIPAQLRADFLASTPGERVAEAMDLAEFLTGVAASAAEQKGEHGRR